MADSSNADVTRQIENGLTILGIEFGSTRIKAVLLSPDHRPLATGEHGWENALLDGVWTYPLADVRSGLQSCFACLKEDVNSRYGTPLKSVRSIGISAMMHGYLAFDANDELLVPFRTWRNNITERASTELTEEFDYPIPQRWSVAHLYQAILNGEEHVSRIRFITTLAGYVHWQLTGEKVLGIGDASGMFPIDTRSKTYNAKLLEQFNTIARGKGVNWDIKDILPEVRVAGEPAGKLTEAGARYLDPDGGIASGIPLCPPEGDAGTGMVATNSIAPRTGNVSAGTSVFAMIVLEKELSRAHHEIDLVTTPSGDLVGMAHSNNCSSDLDAWIELFGEALRAFDVSFSTTELYQKLLPLALEGDANAGGLLSYGYVSGEHLTGFSEGRPLFARSSQSDFTLANFFRAHLFSALCALRAGLDVLFEEEGVTVDEIRGHGGFFKTPEVGQRIMAAATKTPVSVLETAGEGGAWGIALLASYLVRDDSGQSLAAFLEPIFADGISRAIAPEPRDIEGFQQFYQRYLEGLPIERAAVETLS